ncbi:hypothetical protein [Peribacillus butanolivorans]|uniref:hypothetical protein n=1 Tax=Peribacillus butanolivorans TaxID=421767 RepID=UPI00366E5AF1
MNQIVMTDKALEKVQKLAKNPAFKVSLERFVKISKMYTNVDNEIPAYNIFKAPYRRMIEKVHHVDDMYMFRDKSNRFIFTVERDDKNNNTAILLDVLDKREAMNQLNHLNKKARFITEKG